MTAISRVACELWHHSRQQTHSSRVEKCSFCLRERMQVNRRQSAVSSASLRIILATHRQSHSPSVKQSNLILAPRLKLSLASLAISFAMHRRVSRGAALFS
jgi:hypothetical protein